MFNQKGLSILEVLVAATVFSGPNVLAAGSNNNVKVAKIELSDIEPLATAIGEQSVCAEGRSLF